MPRPARSPRRTRQRPGLLPALFAVPATVVLLHVLGAPLWIEALPAAGPAVWLAARAVRRARAPRPEETGADILSAVFDRTRDMALVIDPEELRVIDCNPRACELLRTERERLIGTPAARLGPVTGSLIEPLREAARSGEAVTRELTLLSTGTRESLPVSLRIEPVNAGGRRHLLLLGHDQTLRLASEGRVMHLAYHDTLTDLPNRTLLTDRVDHALQRSQRSGQCGALLFLDLDNFKRINDSLGHSIGDLLLQELASRLRHTLREEDTISRLGGDEFVVLIERLGTEPDRADAQVREIARKIRAAMSPPYHLDGHELHVTASMGYVLFPRDGRSMETLLRHADLAMYQAKRAGRDKITRFDPRMDEIATRRLRTENELRRALRDGRLELHFQPILRIRSGQLLGAEALLRWEHPEHGTILPERFLPQIEDSALMLTLAEWILERVCETLAGIQHDPALKVPDYIAVNIGHQQFHQPDFVARVRETLERTGADPRHLLFEITETVIMSNAAEARARMLELKTLGLRFAIDDFGTGYSSLSHLKQLPADTLKIDRSFIQDLSRDADDAAIVRTVLGIAEHMGLHVIAEGVERQEQLRFLRDHGCASYQGYLGSPPLPADRFHEELRLGAHLRLVE